MMDGKELDINNEEITVAEVEETVEPVEPVTTEEPTSSETAAEEPIETVEVSEAVAKAENPDGEVVDSEVSTSEEAPAEEKKDITTKEEFISEFAPAPIKIPKYDKEKEKRKVQKAHKKRKKLKSKKAKKRRRILRKILVAFRTTLLLLLLVVVATATIASLMVKMNTSEYSIETAIRKSNPESYVIGKIKYPEKINLKLSSSKASVADILRDNSLILVTYADIKTAVDKSTYPTFIAGIAHDVVNYYVYGDPVDKIKASDISKVLYENVSYIKYATGTELGESACEELGNYIVKSGAIKELSIENLATQPIVKYTRITSVMFSTPILVLLVIALMILLVLTVIYCKGFWHKVIGSAIVIAGVIAGIAGVFFKPSFHTESPFIKCIVSAVVKNFNNSAVVFAAVAILVGILVMLVGKAVSDDDDDEYEDEYFVQNAQ